MASTLEKSPGSTLHDHIRGGRFGEAAAFYEREMTPADRSADAARLDYAIALLRTGRAAEAMRLLDDRTACLPNARGDLRRYAISDLVATGSLETAERLLSRLIDCRSATVDDRRLRASLRGRMKRWEGAIADARIVVEERPDELDPKRALIQLLLQAGSVDEAGELAERLGPRAADDPRCGNIALLALTRSGRAEQAGDLAQQMADSEIDGEDMAAAIVRTLVETGREDKAIQVGERMLEEGWEHEQIRSNLGRAYIGAHREDRYDRAIEHLTAGLRIEPDDVRMNMSMGEALLRSRQYEAALPYLARSCELQPKAPQQRALYARALKQVGRYAEAAHQFRTLLELHPSSPRWSRYAAGALSQAGRRKEAAELFDRFVADRKAALPRNFDQGLKSLWDKIDTVQIPKARIDWAWSLSQLGMNDREEWERRAKWGHLADHYLLDWLECRDDRVQDAMMKLADLGDAERKLAEIDRSRGMILASAHVGPMYAGPLALELLGVRSRWLASTPTVARTAYASSLISTSEQDDMQVGKAFMLSLRKGFSVVIAVDGAINLAAPRVPFEGQEITYSSFAARTAHRLGVPSVFAAPRWEGERIGFVIERMPDAMDGESADDHAERWKEAFLTALRNFLGGAPENLRLSGGLWRHVR